MNTIVKELNTRCGYLIAQIEKLQVNLETDFLGQFAWNAEELWKTSWTNMYFKSIVEWTIEMNEEDAREYIAEEIQRLKHFCLRSFNVRVNSTGALHREVSTWEFQCKLEAIETLSIFTK
jgi:hypothetical protein